MWDAPEDFLLPRYPMESKVGFYAYRQGPVSQVICLQSEGKSFVCVIEHPEEAAHTWGARFRYALNTMELHP